MTDFYIYNLKQCEYFIKAGLEVKEIGVGKKGHVYIRFNRDEASEKVFESWRLNSPRYEKDRSDNSCV